jgi:4-carboxymuconolactone decarboxylase
MIMSDAALVSIKENAVLGDKELQKRLMAIDPEFGEFCIRVSGEVFGKPLLDQKTKALIAIAIDVVEQIKGIPFENHVDIAVKQGATAAELKELIFLMTIYAGLNKAGGFYHALEEVLETLDARAAAVKE